MHAEPGFDLAHSAEELVEFVFAFLATGAVGFRYSSLAGRLDGVGAVGRVYRTAAHRAAIIGLIAQLIGTGRQVMSLPRVAEMQHATVAQLLTTFPQSLGFWLAVLGVLGFLLAAARVGIGWPLAAVGVVVGALAAVFTGEWERLLNPFHMLMGGLWLGTLFVLVVAGLSSVLRDEDSRAERGRMAADMVNAFSPLALTCGLLLVASGLLTAWHHLGSVPALWSTPYGRVLIVKLLLVSTVFALGAWNWRRQRPRMGSEEAAVHIRRSARAELTMAALVLVTTSVLVTFPAPAEEHEGAPAAAEGH